MRILYLTQYFPPEIGATQSRALEMASGLAKAGHEVTVVCEMPNHPHGIVADDYRGKLVRRRRLNGFDVIHVWVMTSPDKTRLRRIAFYVSYLCMAIAAGIFLARGKYDIVYCTSPPLFTGAAGLALCRWKRAPLVFEVRDVWPEAAVQLGELQSPRALRWAERLESACYRRAQVIVAVTKGFRDRLIGRGVPAHKIHVITNGVNVDLYRPAPASESLRATLGLHSDCFVAIFTGLHGLAHGMETIVQAAHLLRQEPAIRFLLIGDGPRKAALQQLATDLALTNIVFHPAVPEEELPSYLALADVGLDCRRKIGITEGTLPVKMFSYMACEVPVILCIEGEAVDVVRAAAAGIVVAPEDPQALADAIVSLRHSRAESAIDTKQARRFVERHYSRQKLAARLAELLESLPIDTSAS